MITKFNIFENSEFMHGEPGPAIIVRPPASTIASTLAADGSDGLIGGQNNPGDIGGEFPKKFKPGGAKRDKYHMNIKNIKSKETIKRKKAILKIKELNKKLSEEYLLKPDNDINKRIDLIYHKIFNKGLDYQKLFNFIFSLGIKNISKNLDIIDKIFKKAKKSNIFENSTDINGISLTDINILLLFILYHYNIIDTDFFNIFKNTSFDGDELYIKNDNLYVKTYGFYNYSMYDNLKYFKIFVDSLIIDIKELFNEDFDLYYYKLYFDFINYDNDNNINITINNNQINLGKVFLDMLYY